MATSERLQVRYVLPTGQGLLTSRLLECISDHKKGKDHSYDHLPNYEIAEAIADQNTVLMVQVAESGTVGVD
tara:strand:- start:56856 stop:57071 length:216 start_codon:yes stop_codon:yes gene_type:complete